MTVTESKLQYTALEESKGKTAAVIVAAGNGSRMGGVNKQFLQVGGLPVIVRTLQKFQRAESISQIIVVTKKESVSEIERLASEYGIDKLKSVVLGGDSRQESVACGVNILGDDVDCVLIHDGARPFVSVPTINEVECKAREFGGAACGVKIYDTVKKVDGDGNIVATIDRNSLIRIQTPQGFDLGKYKDAVGRCDCIGELTDDCAVMEWAGYNVRVVEGKDTNIKITTPRDVETAERILSAGGDEV